jgi:hypothetical protein
MAKGTRRNTEMAALLAALYGARRYYRNWGATKAECRMRLCSVTGTRRTRWPTATGPSGAW